MNIRVQHLQFYILFITITLNSCVSTAQHPKNLSVHEFATAITQSNVQVLDVRTYGEYQSGHLKDAFLADWTNQKQFAERVQSLDKSKPVYTYCFSGARSGAAATWLIENGYKTYNLVGGIADWKKAALPVEEALKIKQMSLNEFQSLLRPDRTVLVDIGAKWCPPCNKMNPVIDSLYEAKSPQFDLVKIDGGSQTEISNKLGIESFPTFIIYKNGKEVWRKNGIVSPSEMVSNF